MLGLYGVTGVVLWNVWATNGQRACEEVRGAKFYSPLEHFFWLCCPRGWNALENGGKLYY